MADNFGDFTEQTSPDLDDFLAGYAAGGGAGSDRRFKIRNLFTQSSEALGIGTPSPIGQLEISNAGDSSNWGWPGGGLIITGALDNSSNIYSECIGDSTQTLVEWFWYRTRGNQATPTALTDANTIGQWQIGGRDETGVSVGDSFALGSNMYAVTVGNWSPTNHGLKLIWQTVRTSSTTLTDTFTMYGGSVSVGGAADPGSGGWIGLNNSVGLKWGTITVSASTGTNVMAFAGATAGYTFDKALFLAGGTTSIAQMYWTAGTLTTSVADGQMEYDGKVFYAAPGNTDRGVIPTTHFLSLSANQTGADSSTAQTWFPGGGATGITVVASTSYMFEGVLNFSRSAGTNSHTTGLLFGGTATITSIGYQANALGAVNSFTGTTNFALMNWVEVATDTQLTAASTSATECVQYQIQGMVRINAGGTFIPQFKFSAAPGGAPSVRANTWFRMYPVGTNTVLNVGNWS